ncbi:MAG: PVC-type heme-binding CxxCH protein [Vicinamibacterales bacterium]
MSHSSSPSVVTRGARRGARRALFAAAAALLLFVGVHASSGDGQSAASAAARPLKVLLLGEGDATHSTTALYTSLAPVFARHGIQITHANSAAEVLTPQALGDYDILLLYGTLATITPAQEKALVGFVESGKGLIALNSAIEMFPGSATYAALLGARGKRTGAVQFTAEPTQAASPITRGLPAITTTDDTFTFTNQATTGRTVLMERVENGVRTPQAWTRMQGKGRVFYSAFGSEQTVALPAFREMVERGVIYAVPEASKQAWDGLKMPDLQYEDGHNVPNYENRNPAPKFQLPLTVEESMKFIQVPAGFSLELFASEPDIIKPISFTFDERGRLWVIEAKNYPNDVRNGEPGDDQIKIVEDTNGDGKADKFTVFADHLNLATSLTFANGGIVVAAAPHMLFLKDADGDGKADERKILSTGWGIRDTHAGPSNLQYGPDNYIWGSVGYSGFDGEMNGKKLTFTQGSYRFKPDGSNFEYMTQSTNNTWGLGFSENFDVFGSTANNDPSFYIAIPNRFFDGVQGLPPARGSGPGYQSVGQFYTAHYTTPYIRQVDVFGGYTAGAGHYLYTARAFPKEYWNRIAFITEPTAHLVGQGIIESQGAGFATRDGWNLLSGAEEWVAPVHAQVGPDGAVWVADWYNFIAQHNPTPTGYQNGKGNAYEQPLRDHSRGRIYRVTYKHGTAEKPRTLSLTDRAGLLDALASNNMFWRLHAQRLIVERGQKDVVPQLLALVRSKAVDEVGTNGGALHALWALQGLGETTSPGSEGYKVAVEALKHPAAGVRKAAAMVLPKSAEAAAAIVASGILADADLHTRLAAVLTAAEMPSSPEIGRALYAESKKPDNFNDRWLSRALYIAATRHRDTYLTQYKADPAAVPFTALPVALRLGDTKPDWRTPAAADLKSDWKDMQVPGAWETKGLPDFDGVVWFSRTVDVPQGATPTTLSLGRVSNNAEVWVNGLSVALGGRGGGPGAGGGAGGGRGGPPVYTLPAGAMHPGANTITVRIQNNRNDGGFLGVPDTMFVDTGTGRTPLAGRWRYRVERQTNAGTLYAKPGELAAHVAFTADGGLSGAAGAALPKVAPQAPDVVLRLAVVPGMMKFDLSELTVAPNQTVEIVFVNPDGMQHNFVLGAQGSLDTLGAAADIVARAPNGLAQQYVPDSPAVLFATKLLEPGQTVSFQFKAPADAGKYPYVCTFPAHWKTMNGTLNVVAPAGRGRGGQ